ncbi:hypothetical protein JCGZ_13573 [Jatropha curcas]|uniref:Uncharacterized protein n=1 Tax=Jatropha curcas TaxID=180498 RepID=A0A067KA65_JATCU|nr:protein BIC1 [Jatropha curcas]KDP33126.1 hypothetical protein JCGZ_13573 [Jatropha curcas]
MENTHFSSKNQESTKPIHLILASPAKTNTGSFSWLEYNSLSKLQVLPPKNEPDQYSSFSSPRRHVHQSNDNEASRKDFVGRERLKRHREEVAGQVSIPETWSQENFLKDWVDYSSFDNLLAPNGIASARQALMAEGRRASY